MQVRYVDPGRTIVAEDILSLNYAFFNPALIKGGKLSSLGSEIKIYPGYVLLPNGVLLEETEQRLMGFAGGDGWKTIFYRWVENQVLGGLPIELDCIEGVYSQEELVQTKEENEFATVIGWVNKDTLYSNNQYELVRPNNEKFVHYKMTSDDFVYNRITGKDILDYIEVVNPSTDLYYYDHTLGAVVLFGERNPLTGKPQYKDPGITKLVIRVPWTADTLGCMVVERKADMGAKIVFTNESLNGEEGTGSTGMSEYFDCKGTSELNADGSTKLCSSYDYSTRTLMTNINSESRFHRVLLRPVQLPLATTAEEIAHPELPNNGVLRLEIFPPSSGSCGSDGLQLIRSIGISKYNVPQSRRI